MASLKTLRVSSAVVCLLLYTAVCCSAQWKVPPKQARGERSPPVMQASPEDPPQGPHVEHGADLHDEAYVNHRDQSDGKPISEPTIEILEPLEGSVISYTPWRVRMRTRGFQVPEDGEIHLTTLWEGRGQDVRVLQSVDFTSWSVLEGNVVITAQLITTKDEPVGAPAQVRVSQVRGAHFVLNEPADGQLVVGKTAVPALFMFGGVVPEGARVCFQVSCSAPGAAPREMAACMGDEGVAVKEERGQVRMDLGVSTGNCSLRAAPVDGEGQPLTEVAERRFRVVDDQAECPAGSGVACMHGECGARGGEPGCVCDAGYSGRNCEKAVDAGEGGKRGGGGDGGLRESYLGLVKGALLDSLYAQDRAGETGVVARSMVGRKGLDDLQHFVEQVLEEEVEGDLMETGVWQGGSCILMRAVLRAYGDTRRKVWVADSFQGCPEPDPEVYPQDTNDRHHTFTNLQVPLQKVHSNFLAFELLDDQVEFVAGWFQESMHSARVEGVERLALLRLDGDLYQSTIEVLRAVYYKVSLGGFVLVDDWRLDGMQARSAVVDFHRECGIEEAIHVGSDGLAWWRKLRESACG